MSNRIFPNAVENNPRQEAQGRLEQSLAPAYSNMLDQLGQDLDFHDQASSYASHNFHSFPAKFPPQLPRKFIQALTAPGEVVLDPMCGSGTTVLEALLAGRRAVGVDIDPLAVLIASTKTSSLDYLQVSQAGHALLIQARKALRDHLGELREALNQRWDQPTREFIDQWFAPEIQLELLALLLQIEQITDPAMRKFFELVLSAIIITKTGGVSLALDLAHTRPHRAKLIYSKTGEVLEGGEYLADPPAHLQYATKTLRSAFDEFEKRFQSNLKSIPSNGSAKIDAQVMFGNAQALPLKTGSVDLIVTSPPYASNAIDYMRAHKFSLVWLGFPITQLSNKRKEYVGSEGTTTFEFLDLPPYAAQIVDEIHRLDRQKGRVLHRYYTEMTRCLQEMYRLLKPGKAAIVVVGSSVMRHRDTETQHCLADIGRALGFEVPKIGVRYLDRDRRMMPAGQELNRQSQIQQRMHEEYVIGFYKPDQQNTE
jgi:DNA modification methylase